MKSSIKPGYDSQRQSLKDIVPLDTPFTLFVSPSQLCNFKCKYCSHSLEQNQINKKIMSVETFDKIVDQAAMFNNKFKRVLFTGLGEPLINTELPSMISKMKKRNIADKYEVFTNASLLTREISEKLVEAGLDCLRISIQGLNDISYENICNVKVNFNEIVNNIKYFYEIKGNCKVYIKIIDDYLETEEDEKLFYDIFGNISDFIFIENLVKAQPMMGNYDNSVSLIKTFYGEIAEIREVCPFMFYTLQVDADGNIFPCPPLGLPCEFSLGNVSDESLKDVWYGDKLKKLWLSHLEGHRKDVKVCSTCDNKNCFTPKEDNLDDDSTVIIERIKNRGDY